MTRWAIYQQLQPTGDQPNLSRCGTLYAADSDDAIAKAYLLQVFANAQGGARFPIVAPV